MIVNPVIDFVFRNDPTFQQLKTEAEFTQDLKDVAALEFFKSQKLESYISTLRRKK